jgi:transcriptional regulator with XRE-family HTH domain
MESMENKFGYRLKELRSEKGITQEDLSKILEISFPTISRYENGHRDEPCRSTLKKLANYFGISIDYLVGDSDVKDKNFTPDEISKIFNKLDSEGKKILMDLAKNLLRRDEK